MMEAVATPPTTFRLTPRPYQYEAVAALLAATARGAAAPARVADGTGKTIVLPSWSSGVRAGPHPGAPR